MTKTFKIFLRDLEKRVVPLSKECNKAFFNATISGKEEDYKHSERCQKKLEYIFADKEKFQYLESIKKDSQSYPNLEKGQFKKIYNMFFSNQIEKELLDQLIEAQIGIEKKFATFRSEAGGKKITDNEIDDILATTTDDKKAQEAWLASKKIGEKVAMDIINLIVLRNKSARELGFNNFYEMSLIFSDQDPKEIEKIFNELEFSTKESYAKLKDEIDIFMAKRFNIEKHDLMPWHMGERFLQRAPKIYNSDLDKFLVDKDIVKITENYYQKLGLSIKNIISNSDLYEKNGKYQHAYCIDIDREGDIRMVCNVKPNQRWLTTMLHEAGHAAYDKFIDKDLPWFLRRPPHIFTTEAIAMLFERNIMDHRWIKKWIGAAVAKEECQKTLRLEKMIFSRWSQVMYRFERTMYENPNTNLNETWWNLIEKYQLIKKPKDRDKPDWASKIHIATSPAYYHNYELGELLAAQLKSSIKNLSDKEIGKFLKERVFYVGNRYEWSEMIEKATGNKLTPKYFVDEFV